MTNTQDLAASVEKLQKNKERRFLKLTSLLAGRLSPWLPDPDINRDGMGNGLFTSLSAIRLTSPLKRGEYKEGGIPL